MKTTLSLACCALLALCPSLSRAAAEVGSPAPAFTLTDTDGKQHSLADFKGKYVVLEWLNHNCPFVKKHYDSGNMQKLQKEMTAQGVVWLSINSTNKTHKDYCPPADCNAKTKEKGAAPTALLLDSDGAVGKRYGARTTPHMFVIDPEGKLLYAGAIDDIKSPDPADAAKANNYVRAAVESAKAGKPVANPSTQPYGCSVKY